MRGLSVSIVLYRPDLALLEATLGALERACREAGVSPCLLLVDNGGRGQFLQDMAPLPADWRVRVLSGHGNVGFGAGHNLCLGELETYHLILNPDLELAPDALKNALFFLESNPDCGLVVPSASWGDGRVQYLCKRMPTVFDLLLRGFAPGWLRSRFQERLARYEMRDLIGERVLWDPPIVSGCCMLFRSSVLQLLGGFDPRYFLYFEDFDLAIRAGGRARLAYLPAFRVVHHGGHAARKGWSHIGMFLRSAVIFFRKYGWRWY